jgi:hypothetical protein
MVAVISLLDDLRTMYIGPPGDGFALQSLFIFGGRRVTDGHASKIMPTTGMVNSIVATTHHSESASPRILFFRLVTAIPIPAIPLKSEIDKANRPRNRQPNMSTGEKATAKKATDTSPGMIMCFLICCLIALCSIIMRIIRVGGMPVKRIVGGFGRKIECLASASVESVVASPLLCHSCQGPTTERYFIARASYDP